MVERDEDLMPEGGDELFAELRAAWQGLEAPQPADELAAADTETRAAVAWLQSAWSALEVPAPKRVPTASPRGRLLAFPVRRVAAVAAAAALLLLSGVYLFGAGRLELGGMGLEQGERLARRGTSISRGAPQAPRIEQPAREALSVAAVDAHRVELRSGPVRLLLITGGSNEPNETR